jgi:hypothetical protein
MIAMVPMAHRKAVSNPISTPKNSCASRKSTTAVRAPKMTLGRRAATSSGKGWDRPSPRFQESVAGQGEGDQRFHQDGVFEVGREIAVKIGAGGFDLVDLVFIKPYALQAAKPKAQAEHHHQEQRGDFV